MAATKPGSGLTGSRIRERRLILGVRQADLARDAGISPAYLNLIEHNRRRIGGKLLNDIARLLSVEAAALSEGAEAALLDSLRAAVASAEIDPSDPAPDLDLAEDFAGRFPGWAALVASQHARIGALEATVSALTDRLSHDPYLSAALHDVLSTVTAIRSTAGILADTSDIDPDWQARFHRNLYEDSQRLAEGSQSLVAYLNASEGAGEGGSTPQDEVETWLKSNNHRLDALEAAHPAPVEAVLNDTPAAFSAPARALARGFADRYARDVSAVPAAALGAALEDGEVDPVALARRFGTDMAVILRRIAALGESEGPGAAGLVICDGSGTLTYRKEIDGFPLPRFGAACPLWPLYQALNQPMVPLRATLEQPGAAKARFVTYAVALPLTEADYDAPPAYEASMLILPAVPDPSAQPAQPARPPARAIGPGCRICPRSDCAARREPSILAEGL